MKIIEGILFVVLGITLAACVIITLYLVWFEAIPTLWKEIKKKIKD
jgi:hypothetical protein